MAHFGVVQDRKQRLAFERRATLDHHGPGNRILELLVGPAVPEQVASFVGAVSGVDDRLRLAVRHLLLETEAG